MKNKIKNIIPLLLVVLVFVVGCTQVKSSTTTSQITGKSVDTSQNSVQSIPKTANQDQSTKASDQQQVPKKPTSSEPALAKPETYNIAIKSFSFSPKTLTINKGDTVVWTNEDSVSHTVTSDSGSELKSSSLSNGDTFSHTFNADGTFDYHCGPHPFMKATIIVKS